MMPILPHTHLISILIGRGNEICEYHLPFILHLNEVKTSAHQWVKWLRNNRKQQKANFIFTK